MAPRFQYSGKGKFDEAFDIIDTGLGIIDKKLEEDSQIQLNYMRNQFNQRVNDQLNSMRESDNWENWETQMNGFLDKIAGESSNKDSPFYCKNQYMDQRFRQMIQNEVPALTQKAHEMAYQSESVHKWEMYRQNRAADFNNGLSMQTCYDNGLKELDEMLSEGRINESEYYKQLDTLYADVYTKRLTKDVEGLFDSGIEANMSFDKIWDKYESEVKNDLIKKDRDGKEIPMDRTELTDRAKKQLENTYNAKVKDIQNENAGTLSELYARMLNAGTEAEKERIRDIGSRTVTTMTGLQLSPAQRAEWAYKFGKHFDKSGSGSGSGSGGSQKKLLKEFAQENKASMIANTAEGLITPEEAKEALNEVIISALMNGEIKDYQATSYKDAQGIIKLHGSQYVESFYSDLIDTIFNKDKTGKFAGTTNMLKKLTTDISKNPELYGETTMGYVNSALVDIVVSNNLNNFTDKDLMDFISNTVNSAYAAKVESLQNKMVMQKDKEGNDTGYFDYKNDKQRKEYLTTATQAAEENDVIYSDKNGVVHFKSDADKEAVTKYTDNARLEVARSIGVNPENLKVSYKKDKYGDEITVPEFTSKSGTKYHLEAIKDKKGNAIDYKIVTDRGEEVKSYDYNKMKKQANAAAAAEQKAKKAETKATEKAIQKLWHERETEAVEILKNVDKQPKAIKGLEEGVWGGLDAKDRWTYVKNAIVDCSKNDKLAQETVGMTAEEFKNLPFIEQVKLLTK